MTRLTNDLIIYLKFYLIISCVSFEIVNFGDNIKIFRIMIFGIKNRVT